MPTILMHAIAATIYAGLAVYFWRTRWTGQALNMPQGGLRTWERSLLLVALVFHALSLRADIFEAGAMRFSFSIALSAMLWLAIALYWLESLYARIEGLQVLGLPVAAVATVLPLIFVEAHLLPNAGSLGFRLHFLVAMLAYSLFTVAAIHAVLMALAENALHRGKLPLLLAGLPPLMTMEALLFRLIQVAFVLLTLTLLSGLLFSESLFGKAFVFNHKTVFAMLSWAIFAALLVGRHLRGWRGKTALRWTLSGFATLLLAYVGSRFVLEVILGRG
jgi:ABC-type uncharacterized transport system permease subunit